MRGKILSNGTYTKKMKKINTLFITFVLLIGVWSCTKNENTPEKDTEKPTITINYDGGFPKSCEVLERGKTYTFKVQVSDNVGLAKYAIDIHHNFDHHTHDDQGSKCELEPIKKPKTPFKFLKNYTIKSTPKKYEILQEITIPNNVDTGNYHCQISVIDLTGWQSRTSVDIKIK